MFADKNKTYGVVIVDDSDDDRFLLRKALAQIPRFRLIYELGDGQEAIDYLSGQGRFRERDLYPLPHVMIVDLKMPRVTGYEVLKWLQSNPHPPLTVIVLSSSALQDDVQTSLALGAHGYWSKTAEMAKQRSMLFEIEAILDKRNSPPQIPDRQ